MDLGPSGPVRGISAELANARLVAVFGPCRHAAAVPVVSAGVVVAWLCPDCDVQLPAEWDEVGTDA